MVRTVASALRFLFAGSLAAAAVALFTTSAAASGRAQAAPCGASRIVIEGGRPTPFALPDSRDQRLEVDPDGVLTLRADNPPPNAVVRWSISGLGSLADAERPVGQTTATTIDLRDYSRYGHGLFQLDVTLLSGATEVCSTPFELKITGFGGTAATAAAAAAGVTGVAALLSAMYTANGTRAKVKARFAVQRRRPTGWRRWVPVPAWKRTIIGTIIGALTGLCVTALLQQAGVAPLSLITAIWGLVAGGAVALGAGLSLGAVWTYLRPPVAPEAA